MAADYEFMRYRPEFRSQVPELQTHLWSPDLKRNSAYLNWKYEQNPYSPDMLLYLALLDGKAVGMRGFYGAQWQANNVGPQATILCAGDSVVLPEHRGQGVYSRIDEFALNDLARLGHEYVFNFSASPTVFRNSLRAGWRSVGPYLTCVHPAANSVGQSTKNDPAIDRYVSTVRNVPAPSMAGLVARIGGDGRLRHFRDEKYFGWRFRNPLGSYAILVWMDDGLQAYIALQIVPKSNRIHIVDWEAAEPHMLDVLLWAAIKKLKGNLAIWLGSLDEYRSSLVRGAGFRLINETQGVSDYRPGVLVRALRDRPDEIQWRAVGCQLLDPACWDLRMIYSDAF